MCTIVIRASALSTDAPAERTGEGGFCLVLWWDERLGAASPMCPGWTPNQICAPGGIRTSNPLLRRSAVQNSKCRFGCRLQGNAPFISALNWTEVGLKQWDEPLTCHTFLGHSCLFLERRWRAALPLLTLRGLLVARETRFHALAGRARTDPCLGSP
jgi:hypothetical protein